jgi:hypothetical protein
MKPNTLRTEIFLLPQPPRRFYSKADEQRDSVKFGIDLSDAIHAALNGLALDGKVDWEEVGSDLIDMAVDVLEGSTVHPPESEDMETYPDDAAAYWGALADQARNRVNELLLIADTFLLPYIPAIRKRGRVIAMEGFRAFLKHTYEIQMLMEPKDDTVGSTKPWNTPLPDGIDINTLPAPDKHWFPCNQYDLDIAPVGSLEACFLTDQIKSLSDIEAISFNSMATGHAMESVGYRWDDLQSPHLTMGELLDKPLYLTDDPFKWSSPWLRGDKVLRLTRVKYRITNPLVEIDHPTPYEFLHSADTLPHMRQRHDSIVHVHDRTQDRQMVLLNPKTQVLDVDTVPNGLVVKYLSDIARRVDAPIHQSIVDIPGLAKAVSPSIIPKIKGCDPEAWLIYVFTQLDGEARVDALGITPVHYSSLEVADEWCVRMGNALNHGRGECREAFARMTAMYHRMSARDLTADQLQLVKTVRGKDIVGEWHLLNCTHAMYTTDSVLEAWYEALVRRLQPVGTYSEADQSALQRVRVCVKEYYDAAKNSIANGTIPLNLPVAEPHNPADTPLVFFTSRHAELIYKLTQLQGAQRCNELGITRAHYVDRGLADAWYMDIASKLQGTGGGLSVRALREATRIYKTLIDTGAETQASTQSLVDAAAAPGCTAIDVSEL